MTEILWYFKAGGILMYPLLVCSLVAVAAIIERAVRLSRSRLIDPAVVEEIQTHIEQEKFELAIASSRNSPVLVGRILSKGLQEFLNTTTDIETSMEEAGERGLQILYNNLSILNLVIRIAPLIGLLGTVQGMIQGFGTLEAQGVGKEQLAGAIRVALITTAAGLIIAIPTIVADTYFRARIRRIQAEFQEIFIDVIKTVKSVPDPKKKAPAASAEGEHAPQSAEASRAGH